jgi:uncharacterized membrane protein YfcA
MELLFLGALVAEIGWTIAGFGSSSIFLPIAHQFLDYHNVLVLVAIYHIFGNISRFSLFWQHRDKRIFLLFGIPSVLATIVGARLAGIVDPSILKIVLWVVLICFSLYSLLRPTFTVAVTPRWGRVWGALSWFTAGLIGTGGVLRWAFMTLFGLSKEAYIATIASVALLVDATRIPVYFGQWFLDPAYVWTIPIFFVIAFVGSRIGKKIVARIDATVLRKIILVAIMLISGLLVYQGALGV